MSQNALVLGVRYLAIDLFRGVVYFPLWWYGRGLRRVGLFCWRSLNGQVSAGGVGVWFKNLFVPMYGAYDLWGRVISFFVRLVQIAVRLFLSVVYTIVMLALVIVYLLLPVLIVWQLFNQLIGLVV